MNKIILKSILIYDKGEIVAQKIDFQEGINIITSTDNSKGKTSLSKLLLYSFGAKLEISANWNLNNVFTKVCFLYNDKEIEIVRFKDNYKIYYNSEVYIFSKQSDYNIKLYEILNFSVLIKNKNGEEYLDAVPSILLLPNYISQFAKADERSIFQDLNMYKLDDIRDTFYYHSGILDNGYSKILKDISYYEQETSALNKENDEDLQILQYLKNKLKENKNVTNMSDEDIDEDLRVYNKYVAHKNELYNMRKTLQDITNNIKVLKQAKRNNDKFKEQLFDEDNIICPKCGYDLSTFIEQTLKINLADDNIVSELTNLNAEKVELEKSIRKKEIFINGIEKEILKIDEAREKETTENDILVWKLEYRKLQSKLGNVKMKLDEYNTKLDKLIEIKRSYNERKKSIDYIYENNFYEYLKELNITTKRLKQLNKNLQLNQRFSLEASEMPRLNIASFFAFQNTKSDTSLYFPLILDFPNMDMTHQNIIKCFDIMLKNIENLKKYPQSLIFSINCLDRIKASGHELTNYRLINMNNEQLLTKEGYIENLELIKQYFTN